MLGLLKDRAGVELELIPDAGVTVQVAGLLAAVVALAVYLGALYVCMLGWVTCWDGWMQGKAGRAAC